MFVGLIAVISLLSFLLSVYSYVGLLSLSEDVQDLAGDKENDIVGEVGSSVNGSNNTITEGSMLAYDTIEETGVTFTYQFRGLSTEAIFVNVGDVKLEETFQSSLRDAMQSIEGTKYEPTVGGFQLSLNVPAHWNKVEGDSGGLVIAAELAATSPEYTLNESVALTGAVQPDGTIESVGYIGAKAVAAAEDGKTTLVAPKSRIPIQIDEDIGIVHVSTVSEALNIALDEN